MKTSLMATVLWGVDVTGDGFAISIPTTVSSHKDAPFLFSYSCYLQGLFLLIVLFSNHITYLKALFKMIYPSSAYCIHTSVICQIGPLPRNQNGHAPLSQAVCISCLWSLHLSSLGNSCLGSLLSSIFSAWTIPINCYDKVPL